MFDIICCTILIISISITMLSLLSDRFTSFINDWTFYIVKDKVLVIGEDTSIKYYKNWGY